MLETLWTSHRKNQRSLSFCFVKVLVFSHPLTYQGSIDAPRRYENRLRVVSRCIGVILSKKFGFIWQYLYNFIFQDKLRSNGRQCSISMEDYDKPNIRRLSVSSKEQLTDVVAAMYRFVLTQKVQFVAAFSQNKCNIAGRDQEISVAMRMKYCQIGILLHKQNHQLNNLDRII